MRLRVECVLGHIYKDGPWRAGSSAVDGLMNYLREVVDVLNKKIVLRSRASDAEGVRLLKCIASHQLCGNLSGQSHHWNGIHHCVYEPSYEVCRARTRCRATYAYFARRPRVALRRECGILLVSHQHMSNGV